MINPTKLRHARSSAIALACVLSAHVSAAAAPPAVDKTIDERGVDIITGKYYAPWPSISIGQPGEGGLVYSFAENSMTFDTLFSALNSSGNDFTLTYMGVSSRWLKVGSAFESATGEPGSLTYNSTTNQYTYTAPDGSVAIFDKPTAHLSAFDANEGLVATVTHPTGEQLTYTYENETHCAFWHNGECLGYSYPLRLMAVSSSLGYRIKYEYESATWEQATSDEWIYPARVLAINTTVDDCAPLAVQCTGLTKNWPSLSFSSNIDGTYAGTITDNLGREYVYTRSMDGITSVRFPGSSSDDISISYTSGRVSSLTTRGGTWTYAYADGSLGTRRTTTVTDPGGHQTVTFSNIENMRVLWHTNKANETTSYQYNLKGRLKQIARPEGDYVEYAYTPRGNVRQITEVAKPGSGLPDIVTTLTFPSDCANPVTCNKPTSITDPRGNVTDFTYDPTHGGITKVEQPLVVGGRPTTTYAYVSLPAYSGSVWRLKTIRSCATAATCTDSVNETETTIDYKQNSRLRSRVDVRAGNESGLVSTAKLTYDHNDDVLTIDGPMTGTADTEFFRYDELRRRVGKIGPDPDGSGPLKRRAERVTLNVRGLPIASERGTVTGVSDADWSAFASLLKQTMAYDSHGRLTRTTLTSGATTHAVTQYDYDAEGLPRCTAVRMNPADFASLPDACTPSLPGIFGPDRIARAFYDSADRVNKVTNAYGTGYAFDETKGYTPNGLVSWVQDGNGNRSTYEYDGFDRLAKLRYPDPATTGTSSLTDYDGYTYDAASNVTEHRLRDEQTVDFTYDDINRLTFRDAPGSSNDQTFSYDLLSRLLSVAVSGHTNTFTYNALGQVTTATSPLGTLSYLYDQGGRRSRVTYPDGFFVEYQYDVTGGMTEVRENGATSGVGLLAVYSYDDLGRRTAITRGNGVTTTYTYEPSARLDTLTHNLAGTSDDQILTFDYNPVGQITNRTASNDAYDWTGEVHTDVLTVVNGLNQITSQGGTTFSHDDRGNVTSDGAATYGYDVDDRLTSAPGGAVLKYDAVGRLFETSASGLAATRFLYDDVSLVAEYNSSGVLQRRYVHGAEVDEPVVWYEGTGTSDRRWLVGDERGSIIAAIGSTGSPIAINAYDEYGRPDSDNVGRFQYTGQTWIEAVGLYYYKSRFYDPDLGRFLQTDRIGYSAGLNLYAYVAGDPINLVDPLGLNKDGGVNPPECFPPDCWPMDVPGRRPFRWPSRDFVPAPRPPAGPSRALARERADPCAQQVDSGPLGETYNVKVVDQPESIDESIWHSPVILGAGSSVELIGSQTMLISTSSVAGPLPTHQWYFTVSAFPLEADGSRAASFAGPEWYDPVRVHTMTGGRARNFVVAATGYPMEFGYAWTIEIPDQSQSHDNNSGPLIMVYRCGPAE